MSSFTLLRPYYYGQRKWDNYLLDIQEATQSGNTQAFRLHEDALAVAQDQSAELREQTAALHGIQETLQTGFEEMRAEFHWGFSLLVDRMERQIELVARIAAKLDEIHRTLQSPLMTQARELFQLGQQRLSKGLLDKALDAFLLSEQKNEVDFLLQLQTGKLLLYGKDEDDCVIDLPEAERHLLLAARFADAEKNTIPKWNEYSGQAYFHAGIAAYLIGEQEQAIGHHDATRDCLDRSLRQLARAVAAWPQFIEGTYVLAKCHALLGHGEGVRSQLEILSDRDRRYYAKAQEDKDFDAFRADVEEVFLRATTSPGPLARATEANLNRAAEAVAWAKSGGTESKGDWGRIEAIERDLNAGRSLLRGLSVDIVGLDARVNRIIRELEEMAERALQARMNSLQKEMLSLESKRAVSQGTLHSLTAKRKDVNGEGGGFGYGLGAGFAAFLVSGMILTSVFGPLSSGAGIPVLIGAAAFVPGFIIGRAKSRQRQAYPLERDAAAAAQDIQNYHHVLQDLQSRRQALQQKLDQFSVWCAVSPREPSIRTAPVADLIEYNVILTFAGANTIGVIKALREVTNLGLREAKGLVDSAPQTIKAGVEKAEADNIQVKLTSAGATVVLQAMP